MNFLMGPTHCCSKLAIQRVYKVCHQVFERVVGGDRIEGWSIQDGSADVYPSYGIGGTDATMIVSYTFARDALCLGTFSGASDPKQKPIAVLRDLADMDGITDNTYLPSVVFAYDIWPWDHIENSAGVLVSAQTS